MRTISPDLLSPIRRAFEAEQALRESGDTSLQAINAIRKTLLEGSSAVSTINRSIDHRTVNDLRKELIAIRVNEQCRFAFQASKHRPTPTNIATANGKLAVASCITYHLPNKRPSSYPTQPLHIRMEPYCWEATDPPFQRLIDPLYAGRLGLTTFTLYIADKSVTENLCVITVDEAIRSRASIVSFGGSPY